MARRLVPLLSALAFAVVAAVPASSRAVVCPLAASACCGPPVAAVDAAPFCCERPVSAARAAAFCCGAASCPAGVVTISSRPDPSTAGRPVTIYGRVSGAYSGQIVYLWQRLPGETGFRRVAHSTTDAAGAYRIVRSAGGVQLNSTWYATTAAGGRSPTLLERVRAAIRLVVASPARARRPVSFAGRVTPSHAGERIVLQLRTRAGWRVIAAGRLGSHSRFLLRHTFPRSGEVVVRVLLGADARNARSGSAPVRVSIQ